MTWQFLFHGCVKMEERDSAPPPSGVHFADPVKLPAGATRANENIPNPRHRAETELEGQSIWLSFLIFPLFNALQFGDQHWMYANRRWKPEASAMRHAQVLPSKRQKVRQFRREKGRSAATNRTPCGSAQLWSVHRLGQSANRPGRLPQTAHYGFDSPKPNA
jgi:hypothetical protein